MKPEIFHNFIMYDHRGVKSGKPLEIKPANDAVSRCNRIERTLGLDLDVFLKGNKKSLDDLLEIIEDSKELFNIDGNIANGIASIKNAAKLYQCFVLFNNN